MKKFSSIICLILAAGCLFASQFTTIEDLDGHEIGVQTAGS